MINEVMLTVLIIWFGIALLLFKLDRRVARLEEEIDEL